MLSGGLGDATCSISLRTRVVCHRRFVRTKQRGESSAASCSIYNIFHGRRVRSSRVAPLDHHLTLTRISRTRPQRFCCNQSFFERGHAESSA